MYVYSYCNALSARFFPVDRALNSYFMIMIMIKLAGPDESEESVMLRVDLHGALCRI